MSRIALALLVGLLGALLGGLASKALGLHHFWPGVIVSFPCGVLFFLALTKRWSL